MADRDPDQQEFLSAVHEVANSLEPVFDKKPELLKALEVLCEPERQARVPARAAACSTPCPSSSVGCLSVCVWV